MMNHDNILRQIPDYALGLLPRKRLHIVEQHVAHCSTCQQAMAYEREVAQLVRSTVEIAAQSGPVDIRNLMPAIPQQRRAHQLLMGRQRQLAPALLILILLFGGLILNNMLPSNSIPGFVATAHAATATSTYTPTATLVQGAPERQQADDPPVPDLLSFPVIVPLPAVDVERPLETPGAMPTPLASFSHVLH